MSKIESVYCVTSEGASGMRVGISGITEIRLEDVRVQGDPFAHWNGYDKDGNLLRSINCLCPCDVTYMPNAEHERRPKQPEN